MTAYILAFMMNVNNFNPIIIADCKKIEISNSKIEIQKQVISFKEMDLNCEQIEDKLSYACLSSNKQIVGRSIVLKDLKVCQEFANKTSIDMKNLMNVK